MPKVDGRTPGDALGDRMKQYEGHYSLYAMPGLPLLLRLDGKAFHSFTKKMERPFDQRLRAAMVTTMVALVEECGARAGYTQSDEITLLIYLREGQQPFLGGRIQKLTSVMASTATVVFNAEMAKLSYPSNARFDCRAWNVPTKEEAANAFLWRELDATKNAVSMAARAHCSHKAMQGLDSKQLQELLWSTKGINFNNYPDWAKRGTYALRRHVSRAFSREELDALPPMHDARKNPDLVVERVETDVVCLPTLSKVTNRVDVLFYGKPPVVGEKDA